MRHVETVSPAGCQVTAVAEHMKLWAGGGEPLGPGQPWVTPPPREGGTAAARAAQSVGAGAQRLGDSMS